MPSTPLGRNSSDKVERAANTLMVVAMNARRTKAEQVDVAAAVLRIDLDRSGIEADQDWCRDAVKSQRNGDPLIVSASDNQSGQ
jgi:hypothetical protein